MFAESPEILRASNNPCHRKAVSHGLAQSHQIGNYTMAFKAPHRPCAAKPRLHFISNPQSTCFMDDIHSRLQKSWRIYINTIARKDCVH
ncbi:hypothetical protein SYN60AY4M2_12565 [Synechococcus sp. 60AY4M2]|nr:hypothetical protein SYN60AY4M2_12565 [Synechococcus sp. 60AY4M2]PIL02416.1 hypothetical protein SYN65AY640_03975 [Synechococcus sp. 65AY640]